MGCTFFPLTLVISAFLAGLQGAKDPKFALSTSLCHYTSVKKATDRLMVIFPLCAHLPRLLRIAPECQLPFFYCLKHLRWTGDRQPGCNEIWWRLQKCDWAWSIRAYQRAPKVLLVCVVSAYMHMWSANCPSSLVHVLKVCFFLKKRENLFCEMLT